MKSLFIIILSMSSLVHFSQSNVKYYGHRGCRGIFPENTIEGFKKAIEMGVDGIEWDVVVNKDNELVISHEPYIDTSYCSYINGKEIISKKDEELNIFTMTTSELKGFDCGSKINNRFPEQEKIKLTKPTYKEAEKELKNYKGTILFEIKSESGLVNKYYPNPKKYAEIIHDNVAESPLLSQMIFMSFDNNLLNELHEFFPKSKFVLLVYNPFMSYEKMRNYLNFKPYALGLNHKIISNKFMRKSEKDKITVFAWTVNDEKDAKELIKMGVKGIITDYPNKIKAN